MVVGSLSCIAAAVREGLKSWAPLKLKMKENEDRNQGETNPGREPAKETPGSHVCKNWKLKWGHT